MPPKADLPPRTVDHAYFAPGGLVQVDGSRLHDANSFAKAGLKTVALGDVTAPDTTVRIARLSELPDVIDGLVAA